MQYTKYYNPLVILTILTLLYIQGMAETPKNVVNSRKTELWSTNQPVCILVYNPDNEKLAIPDPYTPPSIIDHYGPGATENDLFSGIRVGPNVTLAVTYNDGPNEGFNDPVLGPDRRAAFAFAMNIWEERLQGPCEISINATMTPRGGTADAAVLASAGPAQWWRDFTNAPYTSTFYPECMFEIFTGIDPDHNMLDINIDYNSDVDNAIVLGNRDWYYGTDAIPGNDIDFVTVTIHELCHGLGFADSFDATGTSWDPPLIYDRFLVNGAGTQLITLADSPDIVTGDNVFWNGLLGRYAYNNDFGNPGNVPVDAPTPFVPGSSIAHLDEGTFTGDWDMQTPQYDDPVHVPDQIVLGILQDIGYSLSNSRYVDDNASGFEDGSSSYPFNTVIEGINEVSTDGHVRIYPGVYGETFTIFKAVTLHNAGGIVRIGSSKSTNSGNQNND